MNEKLPITEQLVQFLVLTTIGANAFSILRARGQVSLDISATPFCQAAVNVSLQICFGNSCPYREIGFSLANFREGEETGWQGTVCLRWLTTTEDFRGY